MVYKIRVILDSKDSVFRDIEIKDKQTLWNLHNGIKQAFRLQDDELSSFYYSDDQWTEGEMIPLEDMSDNGDGEIMSDVYISEAFSEKGSKMLFKYGLIDLWEFSCELLENDIKEKTALNYPMTTFRFGNVPLKAPVKNIPIFSPSIDELENIQEDFDEIGYDQNEEFSDEYDDHFFE